MSKKLDESPMQNELEHSAFFQPRDPQAPLTPPPARPVHSTASAQALELGKEGSREVGKEETSESAPVEERPEPFDLTQKPYRKDSFLFTDEEFEALEDLKRDLNRKHELGTTKQELGRLAVGYLVQDYREHQERSAVVRILKAKKAYPRK